MPLSRPLATSFEGKHGSVRYWVKAELHRPWLLPMKTKKEFTVFEHIDINTPLLLVREKHLKPNQYKTEHLLELWYEERGSYIVLISFIVSSGWHKGQNALLLVLHLRACITKCQNREEGLHSW